MSEGALRLGRSRREDTNASRARMPHAGKPERRLADPRLALQHERTCASLRPADEAVDRGEFLLSADDLEPHLHWKDPDRGVKKAISAPPAFAEVLLDGELRLLDGWRSPTLSGTSR